MARKTKARKSKDSRAKSPVGAAPAEAPKSPSRRSFATLGLYGIGAVVIGGGGTAFARDFMKSLQEQDLDRIGQGLPTIVQIHDPSCSMCRSLQRETRQALKSFDRDEVTYLVANIKSKEGAAFATQMGLSHVTLVLMDGAGDLMHTVQGVTPASRLRDAFSQYLDLVPEG